MPYKDVSIKKEYHRQYMNEYNKTHKMTDEQKLKRVERIRKWNAENPEKLKAIRRAAYLRNKEKIALKQKKYREKNAEAVKENKHNYYLANREKFAQRAKEYYLVNKQKINDYKNTYGKSPKGKLFSYKISAKKRGLDFMLSEQEFIHLLSLPCHYCNTEVSNGIDRKDSELGYTLINSLPCCSTCNYMKRDLDYDYFIKHMEAIIKNLSKFQSP